MNNLGALLDGYRAQRGLSKNALAHAANLSGSYVSLLLRGKKEAPSLQTLRALVGALSLTSIEVEAVARSVGLELTDLTIDKSALNSLPVQVGRPGQHQDTASVIGPVEAGIRAVHSDLSRDLVEESILRATECVRIQDAWLPDPRGFRKVFLEISKKNVRIEILLLDPESEFATQRAIDLHERTPHYVSEQIKDALHVFQLLHDEGVNIQVRLYKSLPSIQQIACGERRFIGFFIHGERSDFAPQLEIEGEKTPLGKFFEGEFQSVWDANEMNVAVPEQTN